MTSKWKLLIADDHPLMLSALHDLVSKHTEFTIVATATDGLSALRSIKETRPDIAVLDIHMPNLTGTDVLEAIRGEAPVTKVILLTSHLTNAEVVDAVPRGDLVAGEGEVAKTEIRPRVRLL